MANTTHCEWAEDRAQKDALDEQPETLAKNRPEPQRNNERNGGPFFSSAEG